MAEDGVACRVRLRPGEGAHRVHEPAAGPKQVRAGGRDRDLELRQTGELLSTCSPQQLRPPARRADPRARCVHEDPVEGTTRCRADRVLREDEGTDPEPVERGGDASGAVVVEVPGDDPAISADPARDEGRLPAWRGACIEDPVAGLGCQRFHDVGRGLILYGEPAVLPSRE